MYKYILQSIESVNWLAVVPLLVFFLFFTITTIRVMRKNKDHIRRMAELPLEEND